ncbi:hypothetical protein J3E71DRAFT_184006, partial [Bipolaris maydis]
LLKLYFSNIGSMFLFISEKQVLNNFYLLKNKDTSDARKSWLCLLNAIFAFATLMNAEGEIQDKSCAVDADVFYNKALALNNLISHGSADLETGENKSIVSD